MIELILRQNNFNDRSMMDLYDLILNPDCRLEKINIASNKFSTIGAIKLYLGMRKNDTIQFLDISDNNLEGSINGDFELFCKHNRSLQTLNMSKSGLSGNSIGLIAKFMCENTILKSLILSHNVIDVV